MYLSTHGNFFLVGTAPRFEFDFEPWHEEVILLGETTLLFFRSPSSFHLFASYHTEVSCVYRRFRFDIVDSSSRIAGGITLFVKEVSVGGC